MYLRNTWYVAGWSAAIGETLTPVRMLGEDIVLYRTPEGKVAALEDAARTASCRSRKARSRTAAWSAATMG